MRRKSRTILALVGIAIGIAAMTTLIALVDGIQHDATDVIGKMKGIQIMDKSSFDQTFSRVPITYESKLHSVPGVKEVVPEIWHLIGKLSNKSLSAGFSADTYVYGVPPGQFEYGMFGTMINKTTSGRILKTSDKGKIMIPKKIAEDYTKNVGDSLKIENKKYEIIGIFEMDSELIGKPIIMSLDDARDLYSLEKDKVNNYYITPTEGTDTSTLTKLIEFKFDKLQANSSQDMMEQIDSILSNLKMLAIIVSIVSAIVAGIGVINTMLMSVLERTKEVGTLKAVGWTKSNILIMILLESIFIGLIGTIVGLGIGYIACYYITASFNITTLITLSLVIQNFFFGFMLGALGGIYPAVVASRMDPITALRFE